MVPNPRVWGTRGGWAQWRWGSCGQVSLGSFCSFLACSQSAVLQGEGQILLGNGAPVAIAGLMLCSLPARSPPSTECALALGLKDDLNWAEMLRAADAGRLLRAGKRSSAGRKERDRSLAILSLGVFLRHQIFKIFLFRAGLEAPCAASEDSMEPCLMLFMGKQLQSC